MKQKHNGVLIAIEGIDGAGKTTQAKMLAESLKARGFQVHSTKEPTKGPWGQKIRASKTTERMSADEELDAFLQDRRQHVHDLIGPCLERNEIVIVDRYYYSTAAYQGARGHDVSELLATNESFAPRPDLLIVMDVPPRLGLKRIAGRGDTADTFEDEDNLTAARAIFANLEGDHILRIDGLESIEKIHDQIVETLEESLDLALTSPSR